MKSKHAEFKPGQRRGLLAFMVLLMFSAVLCAQESREMSAAELSRGIVLTFSGTELSADYLLLSDSAAHRLDLSQISLDGEMLLARISREAPALAKTVHWYFDEAQQRLVIDLGELRDHIRPDSRLEIVITPLNVLEKRLRLSVMPAAQAADGGDDLAVIKDVNVDIK
ncbi:MAG: hypothetical protein H6628_10250 [Calditrichae bacterium]|nr:hypothetical protein [Calditrichia bacterium]